MTDQMRADPETFRQAIVAVLPKLRRFAFALTASPDDADDLLQATVERALNKQALFEAGSAIDRWLFRMCRNLWIDEVRKRRTRGETVEADERTGPTSDGERATIASLSLGEVHAAMHEMGEDHRSVLYLVAVEGRSYKEAAEMLDLPIGTIMSRLARARTKLAEALGAAEGE